MPNTVRWQINQPTALDSLILIYCTIRMVKVDIPHLGPEGITTQQKSLTIREDWEIRLGKLTNKDQDWSISRKEY